MINILFTCAGRRNYLINYFKDALGANGKVYAMDMDILAPAIVDADVGLICPSINHKDYIHFLVDVIKTHNIDAIISLNDLELPILARNKSYIEENNTQVLISSESVIDITFDKQKCFEFFKQNNLLTPKTFSNIALAKKAINDGELEFPVVLKPRWGSASIGIDFPESIEELELAYELQKIKIKRSILNEASENDIDNAILIQEKIDGKEYGLDILNDFEGNFIGAFAKEKLSMRSGETDKAISVVDLKLDETGKKISEGLGHIGNLDCDVIVSEDKAYVIELNPRFGGGYPFSHESGINIAAIYVEWLKGNKDIKHFINFKSGLAFSKCDQMIRVNSTSDSTQNKKRNSFKEISTKKEWTAILHEVNNYEFYHTFDYHDFSNREGEKFVLLVYQEGDTVIAIPFIIRSIEGTDYYDVTSVYGYPGPLIKNLPSDFDNQLFISELNSYFEKNNIVSAFSRLNPFINQQKQVLNNIGVCENMSSVVYIDLTKSLDKQRKGYQKRIKSQINKARRLCNIINVTTEDEINAFIDLYYENMDRVNADKSYYFEKDYFYNLLKSDNFTTDLLLAQDKDTMEIIGGAMFMETNKIVQYHLSGTKTEFLNVMPVKLLIDEMRVLATKRGCKYFNLGGGFGSKEDSLLRFKKSFSKDLKTFNVWKHVVKDEVYNELVSKCKTKDSDYFPAYRCKQ